MDKKKILFVCLGNICRSPAAEIVMHKYLKKSKLLSHFEVDSAGLIGFHENELADERMREHASKREYRITHRAKQIKPKDFDYYDLIIGMDDSNIAELMNKAVTPEHRHKIKKLTDYRVALAHANVPDPYYGEAEDFELVLDIVEDACQGLLQSLKEQ